eukprot:1527429-Pleurochrysis_carterae.AAC.1
MSYHDSRHAGAFYAVACRLNTAQHSAMDTFGNKVKSPPECITSLFCDSSDRNEIIVLHKRHSRRSAKVDSKQVYQSRLVADAAEVPCRARASSVMREFATFTKVVRFLFTVGAG